MSEPSPFHQPYHTRRNVDPMARPIDFFNAQGYTDSLPITPTLPRLRTSSTLHFEYHARYPSPPPTQAGFPKQSANPPPFTTSSSPHRSNGSSSSTADSPIVTLPPLSTVPHRLPMHPGVDQVPTTQKRPQLPRDSPEQEPVRRHTLDLGPIPDQQLVPSTIGRKRTSSYPYSSPLQVGTQQVPPQQRQIYLSSPSPIPTSRSDNPPASPISSTPPSSSISHSPQSLSQSAIIDVPITDLLEATASALEPLRLGFEHIWAQTVQNVRQAMNKMQKELTRSITVERRKNANLMRCLVTSSEKLKGQEWAVEELRKENGSLVGENEQLRRENNQKTTVIDTLNQENLVFKMENEELKKKNDEVKEALTRAAGFIFQYKEELAKVKADAETFRKCREASMKDARPQSTATSSDDDLQWEMSRIHAEKERERIFNDAVKQLRALTATEVLSTSNPHNSDATREREVVKTASALLDIVHRDHKRRASLDLSSLPNLSSPPPSLMAKVHYTINQHSGPSTPPSPTKVVSIDRGEVKADSRKMVDGDVPSTPNSIVKPDVEHDVQVQQKIKLTTDDESRNLKEEEEEKAEEAESSQVDLVEIQRQRQRQARRGPTPPPPPCPPVSVSSSPQTSSRKTSPLVLMTVGMKRKREEYEDGQVSEDPDMKIEVEHSEEGEIVLEREREQKEVNDDKIRHKGENGSADPSQTTFPNNTAHRKVSRRRSYYAAPCVPIRSQQPSATLPSPPPPRSLADYGAPSPFVSTKSFTTQQASTTASTQVARVPKKLGINHMDLLYKTEKEAMICRICLSIEQNPDTTTSERVKAKANTKKFPLNASWTDLISHCQMEHAKACEDMEKLTPSQLAEMKQRTTR